MDASASTFTRQLAAGTAAGIAQNVSMQSFHGGKLNYGNIAADAFGNAFGNAIAESGQATDQQQKQADAQYSLASGGARLGDSTQPISWPSGWSSFSDAAQIDAQRANLDSGQTAPSRVDVAEGRADSDIEDLGDGRVRLPSGRIVRPSGELKGASVVSDGRAALYTNREGQPVYAGDSGFAFNGLRRDTGYEVPGVPTWAQPQDGGAIHYTFDSTGQAFWRAGDTVMSVPAPYAMPSISELEAGAFWSGVKTLPGAILDGGIETGKMIADGYRAMYYGATGNIGSYRSWSSASTDLDAIGAAIVDYSPVGILGAALDERYDLIPGRTAGSAVGMFGARAVSSLNNLPGFGLDVGAATRTGLYSLGEYAALKYEGVAYRSGLTSYVVELKFGNGEVQLSATQLRNNPGVTTVSGELAPASGRWLDASVPTPIPAQVGDALAGQSFNTFGDLRQAIWEQIGSNSELNSGFSRANQVKMNNGLAPSAPNDWLVDTGAFGDSFNIHHATPIQRGGAVYDLSNLRIVSPKVHFDIHYDPN